MDQRCLDISDAPNPFKDLKTKFNDWYDDEGYNSKNKPQQKELKDYLMNGKINLSGDYHWIKTHLMVVKAVLNLT